MSDATPPNLVDGPARPRPLAPRLPVGRRFVGERKVRLGDADRSGRLRLDALTRYTQDVSDDDTTDAALPAEPGWVVRSTVVDEIRPAALGEWLHVETFCSGLGRRWAERRLSIRGDGGAAYEVATLWVCVDPASGRPVPLSDRFHALYGEAAGGRKVSARLTNPAPPDDGGGLTWEAWPLRAADFDIYDHVNNAAYWTAVEEWALPAVPEPRRTTIEYGDGVGPAPEVMIARLSGEQGTSLWWYVDDRPVASAWTVPLPRDVATAEESPAEEG